MSTKVSASQSEEIALDKTVKVGGKLVIACGAATVTIDKSGMITVEGTGLAVKSNRPMRPSHTLAWVASRTMSFV